MPVVVTSRTAKGDVSPLPCFFFFNDTATTEIYTLSLHDALPICPDPGARPQALAQPDRGAAAAGLDSRAGRRKRLLQHSMDRIHGGTGSRPAGLALDGGAAPGRPGKYPASLGRCGRGTPAL